MSMQRLSINKTSVGVVVLNWNCADDSIACATSLLNQQDADVVVVLVDNASTDDSPTVLQQFSEQNENVVFIQNDINSGFAGGVNKGISYCLENEISFIGTLNPDAKASPEWVENLMSELHQFSDAGIATGLLLNSDGSKVDTSGEFYTTWGIPGPRGRGGDTKGAPFASEYVFGSTGGGFIARAELFRTVGLFDEAFFMYFEDVDLCFRAQLRGFKIRYTPRAIAYHKISASTNKVPGLAVKQTFKNHPLLFWKNVPRGLMPVILPRFFISYTLILGHAIAKGRGGPALDGFFRSLALLPHAIRERKKIQSSRTVNDDYIDSIILHDIPPEQTGLRKFRAIFTGRR